MVGVGGEVHGEDRAVRHPEYVVELDPHVGGEDVDVAVVHGGVGGVPPPAASTVVDVGVVELRGTAGGRAGVRQADTPEAAVPRPRGPPEPLDLGAGDRLYGVGDGLLHLPDRGPPEDGGALGTGGVDVVEADAVVPELVPVGVVVPG